jgi:hypothetical protein
MRNKILYITHPEFDFSSIGPESTLLSNTTQLLSGDEYHTSLGDLSAKDILSIIHEFDTISYVPNKFVSDTEIYYETTILLNYLCHFKDVENFPIMMPITFVDNKSLIKNHTGLWTFGCSHTFGTGLSSNDLRYSNILSKELNMALRVVAKPGSSVYWSLRQLINADIQQNDLVVWQITTPERISDYKNHTVIEKILGRDGTASELDVFDDEQVFFNHLNYINFGVRYLRARKIKFVLTSIEQNSKFFYDYKQEYVKYPEYCYAPGFNVDIASDKIHFGPLSNKNLAKAILDHVQCIYV